MTVTIRQTYHNTVDQDHDNLTSHLSSRFFNSSAPLQTVSTGPSGGAVCDVGLRPLACWDCGLEYRRRECTCVSCKCCVLSGRGLSDGLTTRPDEFYWSWCVRVWSWSWGDPGPLGVVAPWGKKKIYIYICACVFCIWKCKNYNFTWEVVPKKRLKIPYLKYEVFYEKFYGMTK